MFCAAGSVLRKKRVSWRTNKRSTRTAVYEATLNHWPCLEAHLKYHTREKNAEEVETKNIVTVRGCPNYDVSEIPIVYPGEDGLLRVVAGRNRVDRALKSGDKTILAVKISAQRYEWISNHHAPLRFVAND